MDLNAELKIHQQFGIQKNPTKNNGFDQNFWPRHPCSFRHFVPILLADESCQTEKQTKEQTASLPTLQAKNSQESLCFSPLPTMYQIEQKKCEKGMK